MKLPEISAVVTGENIPEDGTSIVQRVLHDVRIKTRYMYNGFVLIPSVVVILSRAFAQSEIVKRVILFCSEVKSTYSPVKHYTLVWYTANSRKVVGKKTQKCKRQSRKVVWDIINILSINVLIP